MSPYQRGYRDALLALAAAFDAKAVARWEDAERIEDEGHKGALSVVDAADGVHTASSAAYSWELAAKQARRAAEALPLDPEEP